MTYEEAAKAAPAAVAATFRAGKQAIKGEHRERVTCADTRRFAGSIELDDALRPDLPGAPRWDYGIGLRETRHREIAIWVEVHPASPGEVGVVIRKLRWLKQWLADSTLDLNTLTEIGSAGPRFHWLSTGTVSIRAGTSEARRLAQEGLGRPRSVVELKQLSHPSRHAGALTRLRMTARLGSPPTRMNAGSRRAAVPMSGPSAQAAQALACGREAASTAASVFG